MDGHKYNNYVVKHNSKNHIVVNHNKYETTLKQWLGEKTNKNNWCSDYGKWNAYRPKEEARKIIQGILRAVFELHSNNSIHGYLYHPENYAIQYNEVVIGGDHKENIYIFLTQENCKLNEDFDVLDNPQLGDREAVLNLIFHQILGAKPNRTFGGRRRYPKDLQDLHDLLQRPTLDFYELKLMANHPSMWHWKSRFVYFDRVWTYFKQAKNSNSFEFQFMKSGFNNIKPKDNWKSKVPCNSPLMEVLYYRGKDSYDGKSTESLIRYIRNVRAHCEERVHNHAPEYREPQYIELKITEVSESFLVKLYYEMCQINIEI